MRCSITSSGVVAGLLALLVLCAAGCQSGGAASDAAPADDPAAGEAAEEEGGSLSWLTPREKGGATLWAENCSRCHNFRPAAERSDREWDIIVHHMRVRANLTAREHRQILRFLQHAN